MNNLIIFLKYPEPGRVKTRLGKVVGYKKAASIYSHLTKHLLFQLSGSTEYCITIYYSPAEKKFEISKWLNMDNMEVQNGNNLGEKISHAFDKSFADGYRNAIVIGTDCIEITKNDIENAFNSLTYNYDSVIGPTKDGGYYLIGLSNRNVPQIFQDIKWSSEEVFDQSLFKMKRYNLNYKILGIYNDIDDISDINSNVIKIIKSYEQNPEISTKLYEKI